jgi:hypothetical protein
VLIALFLFLFLFLFLLLGGERARFVLEFCFALRGCQGRVGGLGVGFGFGLGFALHLEGSVVGLDLLFVRREFGIHDILPVPGAALSHGHTDIAGFRGRIALHFERVQGTARHPGRKHIVLKEEGSLYKKEPRFCCSTLDFFVMRNIIFFMLRFGGLKFLEMPNLQLDLS